MRSSLSHLFYTQERIITGPSAIKDRKIPMENRKKKRAFKWRLTIVFISINCLIFVRFVRKTQALFFYKKDE